jgi:excisionase family DNA binding protein
MPDKADLITVAEAAARTGYTVQHIARLIRQGKLEGMRVGAFWLTTVEAVEVYRRSDPKPGRPGKSL